MAPIRQHFELDMMDDEERAQALEDAGLDPDDWDE